MAATLADRRGGAASSRDYLMCPVQLSSFTPEKRTKAHLSRYKKRLAPDSASAPRHHETDQILREGSGQQTRVASEPASQPATIGESNALASVPVVNELGPTLCHCFEKAWSIFKLSALNWQSVGQHNLSQSQSICLYLSAFKTN